MILLANGDEYSGRACRQLLPIPFNQGVTRGRKRIPDTERANVVRNDGPIKRTVSCYGIAEKRVRVRIAPASELGVSSALRERYMLGAMFRELESGENFSENA